MNQKIFVVLNSAAAVILSAWFSPRFAKLPFFLFAALFLAVNISPYFVRKLPSVRLRFCSHGVLCLKTFAVSLPFSIIFQIAALFPLPVSWSKWLMGVLCCIFAESIIFWNGMISVYLSSVQLGIKLRVMGLILGLVPVAHLFMLGKIIKTVSSEVETELSRYKLNEARKHLSVCNTKYPILLVHGVFFRDTRYLNYWGRIPGELEKNGARIFYSNQPSAASVSDCGRALAARIRSAAGSGKVNIIAHSKGGLDSICAANEFGAKEYIASVTTINTPHRGCEFADYLIGRIPPSAFRKIESAYNLALSKLGEKDADFKAAVNDLTASTRRAAKNFEPPEGVFCQSVGSKLNRASGGKFPFNFTYNLVKYFDGPNDGLVSEKSFVWGEKFTLAETRGIRGISHGEMIDLNRENIEGFDVREFYINLVSDLRLRGL